MDIRTDDIVINMSVTTTCNNNYYTDGEYVPWQNRVNMGGSILAGYYLFCGNYNNSLVKISVSHNSTSYTYWAGHFYCNNTPQPISINDMTSSNMMFETFQQNDGAWFIRMYPTVSYNAYTLMRIKNLWLVYI